MLKFNQYRASLLEKIGLNKEIISANGHYLKDAEGKKILDCIAQFGAVPFGHNPEFLTHAVSDYVLNKSPNFIQPFYCKSTEELTEKLCRLAGTSYSYVALTNSGTETVEAGLKLARLKTGRKAILSTNNSFHGKTFSALSATGSSKYSNEHIVDDQNFDKVDFNEISELEEALKTRKYAAFIVEPIQGEGGMIPATFEYINAAAELCKKYGSLLIADEIQTGIGRTGKLFACQHYGIEPDILLLSKALGGGLSPIGAMIAKKSAYCKEFDKKHSSTFANGGLASHVASKVLDRFEDPMDILQDVECKGAYIEKLLSGLENEFSGFFSYSGQGLMYALRFHDNVTKDNYVVNHLLATGGLSYLLAGYLLAEEDIMMLPFLSDGCAIRFEPSLTISMEEINRVFEAIRRVCAIMRHARYDVLCRYIVGGSSKAEDVSLPSYRKPAFAVEPAPKSNKKFAFLMHSTNSTDFVRGLPLAIREQFTEEEKAEISEWMMALGNLDFTPERAVEVQLTGAKGDRVEGMLIFSPIRPEDMMKLSKAEKTELLSGYLDVARQHDIDVVGLGAYTSVISRAGEDMLKLPGSDEFNFTTGNSFTALATSRAIQSHLGEACINKNVAVIGARGSVGRLAAIDLACKVKSLFLVGNPKSGLKAIKQNCVSIVLELLQSKVDFHPDSAYGRIHRILKTAGMCPFTFAKALEEEGEDCLDRLAKISETLLIPFPFEVSLDVADFVNRVDCVLSATSEGKAFVSADIFKPGTQIFDAARPFDFEADETTKVDVFEGGLVELPEKVMFGDCNMIGSKAGINLACLSETVALTMEGVEKNYSIGKKIPYSEALEVFQIATGQGFTPYVDIEKNVEQKVG